MNTSWTRNHIQNGFYMVHTVNLQVPSRILVGIGLHGSLHGFYGTQQTQTLLEPSPDLGSIPRPCGGHGMVPHALPHVWGRAPLGGYKVGPTWRDKGERGRRVRGRPYGAYPLMWMSPRSLDFLKKRANLMGIHVKMICT